MARRLVQRIVNGKSKKARRLGTGTKPRQPFDLSLGTVSARPSFAGQTDKVRAIATDYPSEKSMRMGAAVFDQQIRRVD
jgi:hypothetical protein